MKILTHTLLYLTLCVGHVNAQKINEANSATSGEISVSTFREIRPDSSLGLATVIFLAKGATADEARQSLEMSQKAFSSKIAKLGVEILHEEFSLSSADKSNFRIMQASTIQIQKSIEIRVDDSKNLSKAVDAARQSGAYSIENVQSVSEHSTSAYEQSASLATEDLKRKAKLAASSLGVNLGELISVTITEESRATATMIGKRNGRVSNPKVLVQARFRVN